jgi:hypothetical protein
LLFLKTFFETRRLETIHHDTTIVVIVEPLSDSCRSNLLSGICRMNYRLSIDSLFDGCSVEVRSMFDTCEQSLSDRGSTIT